ncbi:MAG: VacJ family lipoprotein [Hyphomonas sp.]|uniref:MlaA family lipoprotein n=1 Tax=Hyphomonas sp. TaxID=87 RepID=UPI001790B1D1|nr:VacJ family lipoprotein [Hyphomonas sp.]MBA3067491.1 VacJ family lipoprotein [Hyphomonas sp.]MBU3921112.1 VacJ family lipoprotein [Alphaproteobacteria bacterium]MBU4063379.1 VacJ family lipoprotein [Alphaproteobacteria bacterium]MBU4165199.1 VacJ family lipoprotein [Alphaproteobacteria bacterium]
MKTAIGAALASLVLSACATAPTPEAGEMADPYEAFNRKMFAFNNNVDKYAISPAATAYKTVTPEFARDRVTDFLRNLNAPVILANDILQAEPARAGTTFARFGINSTVGILGLWDAADHFGLERHTEDFGQTLATWGIDSGPFLVLPILGPGSPRDFVGDGVDMAFNPLNYAQINNDEDTNTAVRAGLGIVGVLNTRVRLDDEIDTLNSQPEPYIALRRLYSSQRQTAIDNGKLDEATEYEDLPDFDEFEE